MIEVLHQDFSRVPSKPGGCGKNEADAQASCSEPDISEATHSAKLQRYLSGEGLPTERQGDVKGLLDSRHAELRRYKNVVGMSAKCKEIVKWIGSILDVCENHDLKVGKLVSLAPNNSRLPTC